MSHPPDLAAFLRDSSRVAEIATEAIPPLMAQLAALQSALAARMLNQTDRRAEDDLSNIGQLLTVEEAAERLRFTRQYLYEMIRKGQFPCIRHGKYVRISIVDLQAWTDQHREKGFDGAIYSLYNAPNGRKRAAEDPKIALSHSRADGGSNRRPAKHGRPLGARRIEDFRTRVQTDPSAGEDGIEREKE